MIWLDMLSVGRIWRTMNKLAKHPGGRPTKFSPAVYDQVEQYLQSCGKENMSLPTIEGLAGYIGVTSETIRVWSSENKEFSATVKKLADKQKQQLMDDGMYGGKEVNAAMAIFLLKVNHGMKDITNQTNVQVNMPTFNVMSEEAKKQLEELYAGSDRKDD